MQAKTKMRVIVASVMLAMSPLAFSQTTPPPTTPIDAEVTALDTVSANRGQTQVATKIASNFTKLAGSQENALKLVQGLRNGTAVTLTSTSTTPTTGTSTGTGTGTGTSTTPTTTESTITPATGKMGWGNVKIALALAQDSLARAGITNPTSAQLNAALNGGDITVKAADGTTSTVTLKGVLQMRADGMGWGQIAQAGGTKVGPVVSQLKMSQKQVATLPSTGTSTSTTSGVTTAAGTTATAKGAASAKGITTASGVVSSGAGSKGVVTASGVGATQSAHGNAYGRGVVTAAGGGAGSATAALHGKPGGAGVVTATGSTASSVTTASGNGGGNGGGNGKGNGGGNGGGKKP